MATLTEDDVLEQLDAQDNLFSFMKTAHSILLQGIRQFLPSLFVDNDEEIVEYAVKPLLAQSGPLDDIDVALRWGKWINGCTPISRIFPSSGIT